MAQLLKKSTGIIVVVGPFVDAADGFTPETGITLGTADEATIYKHNSASVVDISGATWAHIGGGMYSLTLTTSHTDTSGLLTIYIRDDSVCRPVRQEFMVDFLEHTSTSTQLSIKNVVLTPGSGVNGLYINGSNVPAVYITASSSHAIQLYGVGASSYGLYVSSSGNSAAFFQSNGGNGNGILCYGNGSGSGIYAYGGTTGHGLRLQGGSSSGHGLYTYSSASGSHGIQATGSGSGYGANITAGATGRGLNIDGGSTSGQGLYVRGYGSPSTMLYSSGSTGVQVQAGGGYGLYLLSTSNQGLFVQSTATNGDAANFSGTGTGAGIFLSGGTTGPAINARGGNSATSTFGVLNLNVNNSGAHGIKIQNLNTGQAIDGELVAANCSDAYAEKITDILARRAMSSIESSSDGDALSKQSLLGALASIVNKTSVNTGTGVVTVYKTDGSTSFYTRTATFDASAALITQLV